MHREFCKTSRIIKLHEFASIVLSYFSICRTNGMNNEKKYIRFMVFRQQFYARFMFIDRGCELRYLKLKYK